MKPPTDSASSRREGSLSKNPTIDDELVALLTASKVNQKAVVVPIVLSAGIAFQTRLSALEPLKPLAWCLGIQCSVSCIFSFWQNVLNVELAELATLYRGHAYLVMSLLGVAVWIASEGMQDDLMQTLVVAILLPVSTAWEVRDQVNAQGLPFWSYLVLLLAVVAQFQDRERWKVAAAGAVLDTFLVLFLRDRRKSKTRLLDDTCGTLRRLFTTTCDGILIVANTGEILMSDNRILDLIGGPSFLGLAEPSLSGVPISRLIAHSRGSSEWHAAEGTRIVRLKSVDATPLHVDISSVKCSLPQDLLIRLFGRSRSKSKPQSCFLCMVRQTNSPGEQRPPTVSEFAAATVGNGNNNTNNNHNNGHNNSHNTGSLDSLRPRSSVGLERTASDLHSEAGNSTANNNNNNHNRHGSFSTGQRPSQMSSGGSGVGGTTLRLEESTLERLRVAGLNAGGGPGSTLSGRLGGGARSQLGGGSQIAGSEVGRVSQVGCSRFSEVGRASQVSGFSNTSSSITARHDMSSAATLANRRLQLMGKDRNHGAVLERGLCRGTPMILELDLPVSEVSSVVSDVHPNNSTAPSPMNVRMRMQKSRSSAGTDIDNDDEEFTPSEVRSLGPSNEGHVRVQVSFRSQLLSQQFARLDNSEIELNTMRRDMQMRNEVQEEQKAVLKRFNKIVTRDFEGNDFASPQNVTVFLFEARNDVRETLEGLCAGVGYSCRSFSSVSAGAAALHEESGIRELLHGLGDAENRNSKAASTRLRRPDWRHPSRTQLVMVSTELLDELRAEWRAAGIYVVVFGANSELEDIRNYLGAADDSELGDTLRTLGVCEHVELPFGSDAISGFANGAMHHRFSGDFLLIQHFGRGATGAVYGAKRLRDGEVFALKEVNMSKVKQQEKTRRAQPSKDLIKQTWKEVEILGNLKWPTIVELIDSWVSQGGKIVYLLMTALVGGSVQDQIEKSSGIPLPSDRVLEWYAQALHGVAYLHWCGVLHRDIKTDNLLLDINGRSLRIADFGSAVLLPGPGPHPTKRNCVRSEVTTIRITAPEVFTKRLFYPGSDLWSIGASFYEVLSLTPLLNCDASFDELVEISSAMDELPVRTASASSSSPSMPGKVPDSLITSWVGLLQQAQPVSSLANELMELLEPRVLKRPTAAALLARPRTARDLRRALEAGPLWDPVARTQHLAEFDRLLAESTSAADLEPPLEVVAAEAAGEAELVAACTK